jgi:hypothetical protein
MGRFLLRSFLLLAPVLITGSTGNSTAADQRIAEAPKVTVEPVSGGLLITIEVAASPNSPADQSSGGGWEQRFEKVSGVLDLRVGGSEGQPIRWPDRGNNGSATWTSSDPQPDTRSITRWVGNNYQISLWAKISSDGRSKPLCYMDTLYNGNLQQRWEFYDVQGLTIKR